MPEGYNGAYTGQQIDEGIAKANGALPQSGGVMTGPLSLAGDPAGENEATRKAYVDNVAQTVQSNLTAHTGNTNNPHGVTAEQVGADVAGSAAAVTATLTSHTSNSSNPHSVTAEQVGARPDTWTPTAAEVGAAAASHSHGAGEITSGVLAIANGGTGYSSITDSSYSTARYRASALFASETAPTVNGVIHWTYE